MQSVDQIGFHQQRPALGGHNSSEFGRNFCRYDNPRICPTLCEVESFARDLD
jgi:hypothetical protein